MLAGCWNATQRDRPNPRRSAAIRRPPTRTRAILAAARACLLADGYANLSTRRVAEAAEVPLSQIHYHFGSKRQLILAVLDAENDRLLERQREMFDAPEPLWVRWELACDFLDADLESGLCPDPPGDDRRRLVRSGGRGRGPRHDRRVAQRCWRTSPAASRNGAPTSAGSRPTRSGR